MRTSRSNSWRAETKASMGPVPLALTVTGAPESMRTVVSSTCSSSMVPTWLERNSKRPHGCRPGAAEVGRYSSAKTAHRVSASTSPP